MNIHFRLSLKRLADMINQRFEDVIFEGDLAKSRAWAKVQKAAPIVVDGEGDKLYISVPLEVQARLTFRERLFGDMLNMLPRIEKTQFRITAHFTIRLETDDEWNLNTYTLGSFRWDKVPEVGFGPLKVKITSFLRSLIQTEIDETAHIIDQQILEEVALKKRLTEAWSEIQQPIPLHDDPPVWLLISPQSNQGQRKHLASDHVNIDTAVSLPILLSLSLTKESNQAETPFPVFEKNTSIVEDFSNMVESKLSYSALEQYFTKQTFPLPSKKGQIQIVEINIQASQPRIHAQIRIQGKVNTMLVKSEFTADASIAFTPKLNSAHHIEASDLAIEVVSPKWWLRNVNRFGNSFIKKAVHQAIEESISEIDRDIKEELDKAFKGTKIADTLQLTGRVSNLEHQSISILPQAFHIQSKLEGAIVFEILL